MVRIRIGPTPAYVVTDPALTRKVLGTDAAHYAKGGKIIDALRVFFGDGLATIADGDAHLRNRRLKNEVTLAAFLAALFGADLPAHLEDEFTADAGDHEGDDPADTARPLPLTHPFTPPSGITCTGDSRTPAAVHRVSPARPVHTGTHARGDHDGGIARRRRAVHRAGSGAGAKRP
ncbi:hypothetical protein QFZ43_008709 [Streptomyces afghaniensis]|nr:hypothetical protein [Streptomyces afghaniensis]